MIPIARRALNQVGNGERLRGDGLLLILLIVISRFASAAIRRRPTVSSRHFTLSIDSDEICVLAATSRVTMANTKLTDRPHISTPVTLYRPNHLSGKLPHVEWPRSLTALTVVEMLLFQPSDVVLLNPNAMVRTVDVIGITKSVNSNSFVSAGHPCRKGEMYPDPCRAPTTLKMDSMRILGTTCAPRIKSRVTGYRML